MNKKLFHVACVLCACTLPLSLVAQPVARPGAISAARPSVQRVPAPLPVQHQASAARTLLGATAGAVLGGLAGSFIGVSSSPCSEPGNPDACLGEQLPGAIWGTGIGITIGAPLGAHLGNRRNGKLVYTALASGALFAAQVVALNALVEDNRTEHKGAVFAIAFGVPVLQILATTAVERATSGK